MILATVGPAPKHLLHKHPVALGDALESAQWATTPCRPAKRVLRACRAGVRDEVARRVRSGPVDKGRSAMVQSHYIRSRGGTAGAATHSHDLLIGGEASGVATALDASSSSPQPSRVPHQSHGSLTATNHSPPPTSPPTVKLDLSAEHTVARKELLREAFFPNWKDAASSSDLDHPEEMQKKDPLATQIWKLYKQTKTQLPNQERMENLTWRMMAMNLKRKEREQARSVSSRCFGGVAHRKPPTNLHLHSLAQQRSSAPSGIAQLRQSIDATNTPPPDPMNLDDFIFSASIASPSDTSPSPPHPSTATSANTVASAIPIKARKGGQDQSHSTIIPAASVPVPLHDHQRAHEFDYIRRHVRKTSIDDRKVKPIFYRWRRCFG